MVPEYKRTYVPMAISEVFGYEPAGIAGFWEGKPLLFLSVFIEV
jgi:hypothetical protein